MYREFSRLIFNKYMSIVYCSIKIVCIIGNWVWVYMYTNKYIYMITIKCGRRTYACYACTN